MAEFFCPDTSYRTKKNILISALRNKFPNRSFYSLIFLSYRISKNNSKGLKNQGALRFKENVFKAFQAPYTDKG